MSTRLTPRSSHPPLEARIIGPPLSLVILLALWSTVATAQEKRHPLESADTSSPRATLKSFIAACEEAHKITRSEGRSYRSEAERAAVVNRVLRCLDLSELAPSVRASRAKEAAACLKEVLDRIELPPESDWPDARDIDEQEITRWTIPHTEITISKRNERPREGDFLVNSETVERAAEFYERVRHLEYQDRESVTAGLYEWYLSDPGWMIPRSLIQFLPSWFRSRVCGQAIWQWITLVLTLLLGLIVILGIYLVGRKRARIMRRSSVVRYLITLSFSIGAMLVPVAAKYFAAEQIRVSGTALVVVSYSLELVFLFTVIILLLAAGSRIAELIIATPWIQPGGLDAQVVRLTSRVLSLVAAAIVLLEGGQRMGIPLTTLVAGAGVGGLALALAAQDTLKNVLGSMMIILDKPYKVGERIVVEGHDGIVEEIGLRSTKIRLLTGHQTSIPNEHMARCDVENVGRRPYIRRTATIEIPSDAPVDKVKRAVEIARSTLENHEGMNEEYPPRVFLRDINESSIGIFLSYWYHPPAYWDYLAFTESVNLQIMERFEDEGIPFASPALTVHMDESDGSDSISTL